MREEYAVFTRENRGDPLRRRRSKKRRGGGEVKVEKRLSLLVNKSQCRGRRRALQPYTRRQFSQIVGVVTVYCW